MMTAIPDWFWKGGVVMWPLLACSVAAVAVVLERMWALRRRRVLSRPLLSALQAPSGAAAERTQLRERVAADPSVLGELARVAFDHAELPKAENLEAVQAAARQVASRLERGLTTLALVVELGPLLGLLGAVAGMVRVFGDVARHGLADPIQISGGISEALIATFTGLSVAIPALVAYMYLRRRVDNLALDLERHMDELLRRLYR
jgi:biopolymer transport protein ExbB